MNQTAKVVVVGSEPSAFSCAQTLVEAGLSVQHIFPSPFGLLGASRDIGLAYPELGEPYERLSYAIGSELALDFHTWSKQGVVDLEERGEGLVKRGSRLWVTRTDQEAKTLSQDATLRSLPPVEDAVRLMAGAAASNYAPIEPINITCFEINAVAFSPVKLLDKLLTRLRQNPGYTHREVDALSDWSQIKVTTSDGSALVRKGNELLAEGEIAMVCAGLDTQTLLDRFKTTLLGISGQAFQSSPLRETVRASVVGITGSWGYERYRFDSEQRLIGCGVDPTGGGGGTSTAVDRSVLTKFLARTSELFSDFDGEEEKLQQWAVQFTQSCDGLPLLGPLSGEPRIQVCTGFGISAWSRGWQAGRALALEVLADDDSLQAPLIARCSPRRFS